MSHLFLPLSFLTVCSTPGQSGFSTRLHPGRRHQQAEAHRPPDCTFPPNLTTPPHLTIASAEAHNKGPGSLLSWSSSALMNGVVILTPDPCDSAALVMFLSCLPCLMLIYNFINVLTLVLLTFMGQETCQHALWCIETVHLNIPSVT